MKKAKAKETKEADATFLKQTKAEKTELDKRVKLIEKTEAATKHKDFPSQADDWPCFVCFGSWHSWQTVKELRETGNARNTWMMADCGHAFCPRCANDGAVGMHKSKCPQSVEIYTRMRRGEQGEQITEEEGEESTLGIFGWN